MFEAKLYIFLKILIYPFASLGFYKKDYIKELSKQKSYEDYWNMYKEELQTKLYTALNQEYTIRSFDYIDMIIQRYYGYSLIRGRQSEDIYIDILSKFAKSFISNCNGRITLKYWKSEQDNEFIGPYKGINKIALWNTLNRMMCTDIIVISYLLDNGKKDLKFLNGYYSAINLEDIQLEKILEKGVAETHIHSNASINFTISWTYLMNLRNLFMKNSSKIYSEFLLANNIRSNEKLSKLTKVNAVLRIFMVKFLVKKKYQFKQWIESLKYKYKDKPEGFDEVLTKISMGYTFTEDSFDDSSIKNVWEYLESEFNLNIEAGKDDYVSKLFDQQDMLTTGENIFLFKSLKYIKENRDELFTKMFFQYLRVKNAVFQAKVQQDSIKGLKNFHFYYNRSTKMYWKHEKQHWLTLIHCQFQNINLKKLEFRFGFGDKKKGIPDRNCLIKRVSSFLEAYDKFLEEWIVNNRNINPPQIGLIFHMIKRLDEQWYDKCWQNTYDIQDNDERAKELFYSSNQQYYKSQIEIFNDLRTQVPYLDKFLIGIDAASIEDNTEPWVFAPIYKMARNSSNSSMFYYNGISMQTLGFTFHVGEDFRHILTGLRHVDEVVEHFSYRAGDRIGHGIALGINPEYWCAYNEIVMIPRGEYFDDLLWVWGIAKDKKGLQYVDISYLEQRIMELAEDIFLTIDGITVYMLWKAYIAKFNEFEPNRKYESESFEKEDSGIFCKYITEGYGGRGHHWSYEEVLYIQHCRRYAVKLLEPIQVTVEPSSTNLYSYLQRLILDKINNNGIIIETNPTSNLSIGEIKDLFNHYIFNLNDLNQSNEHARAIISINSDDPSVFNTNVSNEISYIFYALQKKGYSREESLNWIDKIRNYGMKSSFLKDENITAQELKYRIEYVLEWLE